MRNEIRRVARQIYGEFVQRHGSSNREDDSFPSVICENPESRETSVSLKSGDGQFGRRGGGRRVGRGVDLGEVLD